MIDGEVTFNVYIRVVPDIADPTGVTLVGVPGVLTPVPLTSDNKLLTGVVASKPVPIIVNKKEEGEVIKHEVTAKLPSPTQLPLLLMRCISGVILILN